MNRRTFLLGALGAAGAAAGGSRLIASGRSGDDRPSTGETRMYGTTTLRRRHANASAPNVLFISIDDCNDWLGFLNNHPGTYTPNLDALAANSLVFTQAYCTAPMCLPSRTSVLFGPAPYRSHVYDHSAPSFAAYRSVADSSSSLIDDLWAEGYEVLGTGKVFHDPLRVRWSQFHPVQPYVPGVGRDRPTAAGRFDPGWISPYDGQPIGRGENFKLRMVDFGPSGVGPDDEPDGKTTAWAVQRLQENRHTPFLLALGHFLPHEPWRLPQKYFDLHPIEAVVVPEIRPEDLGDIGAYARDKIVDTAQRFEQLQASGLLEEAVQAYQAAISFADDRVGLMLDALAHSPYSDDTVVVVWSDHGYHLGEKLHMEKFTLWERATRVPLVIHAPGRFDHRQEFDRPVSLLDLGPTVAELCGAESHAPYDGHSLLPLVNDPALADGRPPIMTWLERNHAVRRGPWRYIRYRTGDVELYDHRSDPNEYNNLSGRPEHAAVESELAAFLPSEG